MKIAGYKWLFVNTAASHVSLVSAFDASEWRRGTNHASYPPESDTLWGFNAYYGVWRARWHGRNFGTVMVGLVGFGSVALFQHGWRAEKAEIVAVHIPQRLRGGLDRESRSVFAERLHLAYDVPVLHSLKELRRETERFGAAGRSFLHGGESGGDDASARARASVEHKRVSGDHGRGV